MPCSSTDPQYTTQSGYLDYENQGGANYRSPGSVTPECLNCRPPGTGVQLQQSSKKGYPLSVSCLCREARCWEQTSTLTCSMIDEIMLLVSMVVSHALDDLLHSTLQHPTQRM